MTDQLSLRLEPALPNLPQGLRPMLARPIEEPFDSPDHLFEPAWGGRRVLVLVGPAEAAGSGEVRFLGEDGDPLLVPPELTGLSARVDARSAILDGELVAVDGSGRSDPAELARRLRGEAGRSLAFLAFDLVHLDGRSLLGVALDRRRELLRRVLRPGDEVVAVPAIVGEGRALHDAVTSQGIAGVTGRHRASPYLPGVRSHLWRFAAAPGSRRPDAASGPQSTAAAASAPVIALIRRLPLSDDD